MKLCNYFRIKHLELLGAAESFANYLEYNLLGYFDHQLLISKDANV